jgi:hypothetical protein
MLAGVTAVSMLLNYRQLNYRRFFTGQEKLILAFVAFVWLSDFATAESIGRYSSVDHPTMKMTKICVFLLMLSHVVTDRKRLKIVAWALVIFALVLGLQAYEVPMSAFNKGRLETVGGADFGDANRFGGFMASMLFIVGCQFLNCRRWYQWLLVFLAGGFAANAIVLTRSRGALLGVAAGMLVAIFFAAPRYRKIILVGIVCAGLGMFYLSDETFVERGSTIVAQEEERDASAQSRLEIWKGGLKMFAAHPVFGVGPGNFYQNIGIYQPLRPGRDAHNTLVRCAGELGAIGLGLFVLIVLNAFRLCWQCMRQAETFPVDIAKDFQLMTLGFMACLAAMLAYGMTGTLLYTEYLWWLLIMPVALQRAVENEREALQEVGATEQPQESM